MITLGIPQIIMLVLMTFGLLLNLVKHGEDKEGKYNFATALIAACLEFWILYAGGFFK